MLYAGPIRADNGDDPQPCFQDIVLASVCPPRSVLVAALSKKAMANRMTVSLCIIHYLSVSACRFKRQISDKPQCAGSEAPTRPQYIE